MNLSASPRRALVLLLVALVGSLVAALALGVATTGGDEAAVPAGSRQRAQQHAPGAGTLRLDEESGGVSAADVPLAALARHGAVQGSARRSTSAGAVLDTGPVATDIFSMLGVTWSGGPVDITARTRSGGTWSAWHPVPVLTDLPDRDSGEGIAGQQATEPTWVGPSDGVQVRVAGAEARDLDLALIQPDELSTPAYRPVPRGRHSPLLPRFHTRSDWGADDSLRDGAPYYNDTIKQVHIHHTVSTNTYSRGDVAGLIRGMYRYHTQNLGWSDIGYNFLVDRFGRIWVGRAGGAAENVRGAHTLGFNQASTGISVIGNFEAGKPNRRIIAAITRVAAWKLARDDRHPRAHTMVTSHGSDRFGFGRRVRLPVIDGHRDTNETACPGAYLYERIKFIRRRTAARIERVRGS